MFIVLRRNICLFIYTFYKKKKSIKLVDLNVVSLKLPLRSSWSTKMAVVPAELKKGVTVTIKYYLFGTWILSSVVDNV